MKANAPEKIYLLPDDRNPNGLSICWYEAPYKTDSIEYTRTDAFIDAIKYGKNIVLSELEKIVKDKEEVGKNYVFVFSEIKELIEKLKCENQ